MAPNEIAFLLGVFVGALLATLDRWGRPWLAHMWAMRHRRLQRGR